MAQERQDDNADRVLQVWKRPDRCSRLPVEDRHLSLYGLPRGERFCFHFFGVWPATEFETKGNTKEFEGRQFCPECGSRVFSADENEAEIKLGILNDAPTPLSPTYELWIKRREKWLVPIEGAEQYDEDRA